MSNLIQVACEPLCSNIFFSSSFFNHFEFVQHQECIYKGNFTIFCMRILYKGDREEVCSRKKRKKITSETTN
jgi:hypothetical protein